MAERVWSSSGSTDMNDPLNYSGSGAILSGDTLVFNGTSVINATATTSLSVVSITITTAYTGTWNDGGFAITTSGAQTYDPTGILTLSGTHTITGDANFHIGTTVTTLTLTNCDLYLQGTGNLDVDKTLAYNLAFRNVTLAYSGKTVTHTGASDFFMTGILTLDIGVLTLNNDWYIEIASDSNPLVAAVGHTINGGTYYFGFIQNNYGNSVTITLPALNIGGTVILYTDVRTSGGSTTNIFIVNMGGAIVAPYLYVWINSSGHSTLTFNTNNYDITLAGNLSVYSATSLGLTYNFGSSVVTVTGSVNVGTNNGINTTSVDLHINLGSSVWNCYSHFWIGIKSGGHFNSTVDAGTATINFLGSATSNISVMNECGAGTNLIMPDMVVNKTGLFYMQNFVLSTAGNLNQIKSLDINGSGAYTHDANRGIVDVIGAYTIDTTGVVHLHGGTSGERVSGAGTFHVGSGVGVCDFSGCNVELTGSGATFDIDKTGLTFTWVKFNGDGLVQQSTGSASWTTGRLYIEPGTTVKFNPAVNITVTTVVNGDIDGTIGKLVTLCSISDDSTWNFINPISMVTYYVAVKDSIATNQINSLISNGNINNGNNTKWCFVVDIENISNVPFAYLLNTGGAI